MEKVRVILDSNEASKDTTEILYLKSLKHDKTVDFDILSLESGDLLINNILLEFKTYVDLISRQDGVLRINSQRKRLLEAKKEGYKVAIVILDDSYTSKWHSKHHFKINQQNGVINSLFFKYGIPVFAFPNKGRFISWIDNLIKRESKGKNEKDEEHQELLSVRTTPRRLSNDLERLLYFLQGFDGIGKKRASEIVKYVGSMEKFIKLVSNEEYLDDEHPLFKIYPKKYQEKHTKLYYKDVRKDE